MLSLLSLNASLLKKKLGICREGPTIHRKCIFWLFPFFRHQADGIVFYFLHNVICFAQLTPVCFVPIFFAYQNEINNPKKSRTLIS